MPDDETPGQDLEPVAPDEGGGAGEAGTAVAVAERPGALELAAHEQRVELRKDRMFLPFLIPVIAILTVALFTINLSRIFLAASENSKDPAVIAAIIATLAVLIGATVVAAIPKLRTSTLVLTMCSVIALVLLGLAFDEPQFSYVNLAVPSGKDAAKIDAVQGQKYTIYCTLPGHRAAGMQATLTVGPKGSGTAEAGTATPTTTLVGGATSTTAPKGQSEVDQSQQSGTSQTGN